MTPIKKRTKLFGITSHCTHKNTRIGVLYYNPELIKKTLGKERTQMDECVDSAMLSKTRGHLQVQT